MSCQFNFLQYFICSFQSKYSNDKSILAFTGGDVGLAITQVMSLTGMIQWGMRQSAEVTNQLMSVERVLEYSELPAEPNLRDKGNLTKKKKKKPKKGELEEIQLIDPPKDWPIYGRVEFKSVYMRYSDDDPPVLKGLTMAIRPSEKVMMMVARKKNKKKIL